MLVLEEKLLYDIHIVKHGELKKSIKDEFCCK